MPKLTHIYIKDKLNQLGLELLEPYHSTHKPIKVKCRCGNIYYPRYNNIKYGKSLSCGHCDDPKIGDMFGNLTIINVYPSIKGSCSIQCKCLCGKICGPYIASYVTTGHIISCGNCKLKINGKFTSKIALSLHNIIEQILDKKCEHNYHIKNIGCIDIVNIELKIAIEYDGYYYHKIKYGDREPKDNIKKQKLIKDGWKVLRIKSDGRTLPSELQLKQAIEKLLNGSKIKTITMPGWKNRSELKI